ncbi:tetratricopeptide repeat protein [Flavobacterium sp.]|uniref:tetratricopeptide repeat protein n=1 Tax=Flavobacterium sp. TaxID=239 RepID=UPI002B4B4609|nr:tetratricopeptide repeat protein [Flavobacterium sp.]HLP64014.1 tetratricopeptide repeat protein [Flavobacterium sp.]
MNLTDYTYLINKPDAMNERHHASLEKVVEEFPYFQSARVLRLKHLYNQNSFIYNYALKVAAAYTTDRSVLFDFITSPSFTTVQNGYYEQKLAELLNINVIGSEVIDGINHENEVSTQPNALEQSILSSIKESDQPDEDSKTISNEAELSETKLEIGKPLDFSVNEKHSFQEWLQLSRFKPIDRNTVENQSLEDFDKKKKLELIDKFLETNPKIPPISKDDVAPIPQPTIEDKSYLMTETLARVYLEQKKYSRAIQAYEILILKYPEKSSFFADRISEINKLQQNNS